MFNFALNNVRSNNYKTKYVWTCTLDLTVKNDVETTFVAHLVTNYVYLFWKMWFKIILRYS